MSTAARVTAHAKLNLSLRVGAAGADGFHEISTAFIRIALGDDVVVRLVSDGCTVDCRGIDVGPSERNLALRAAQAYIMATGWPSGVSIGIDKHVPVGGGLGGGSADSGAVLRALDALAPRPVGERALLGIAARVGSDVPYLTTDHPVAWATGRGERLDALSPLGERQVALVCPPFGIATAQAYAWLDADRADAGWHPTPMLDKVPDRWSDFPPLPRNDLEPPVSRRHPEIARSIAGLRGAGARIAGMSGSGSTVFGVFDGAPDPAALAGAGLTAVVFTHTLASIEPVELLD